MMIPTERKTKIPLGWSYPIGAEVVSVALQGIPQYENTGLRFLWMNPTSRDARQSDPSKLILVSASYGPPGGPYPPNWGIDVHAIPSPLKARLKDEIIEQVLPTIQRWMTEERTATWYSKYKYLTAEFDLNSELIAYFAYGES